MQKNAVSLQVGAGSTKNQASYMVWKEGEKMIPKTIHYCWFGQGAMSKTDQACIDSWQQIMPDYTIKRWDESNFDVHCCAYTSDAYKAQKWAYVSDCARFMILYNEGGLFLDTDVKAIKSYDDLLHNTCFMGMERPNFSVNPGSIVGAEPKHPYIKDIRDRYMTMPFIHPESGSDVQTSPVYVTKILQKHGFVAENRLQKLPHATIYPCEAFAPMDIATGITICTSNTYSVHLYNLSWGTDRQRKWFHRKFKLNQRLGTKWGRIGYLIWSFPERCYERFETDGLKETLAYAYRRLKR